MLKVMTLVAGCIGFCGMLSAFEQKRTSAVLSNCFLTGMIAMFASMYF